MVRNSFVDRQWPVAEGACDRESIAKSRQLAGRVVRYHTWPMIRKPTIGEHVARVASIYCELWGIPRGEVLYYCLKHDDGEQTAGDMPFNAKGAVRGLRACVNEAEELGRGILRVKLPELTHDEFRQFKICDLLEMWECGWVEYNMGNRYALPVVEDTLAAALDVCGPDKERAMVLSWTRGEHRAD